MFTKVYTQSPPHQKPKKTRLFIKEVIPRDYIRIKIDTKQGPKTHLTTPQP